MVYFQFLNHITANKLIDTFQSACKPGYSIETILIRVVKDLFNAIDNGNLSLLTIDLSAAFDTIDHSILLKRLHTSFGINRLPLKLVHLTYLINIRKLKLTKTFLMHFQFCRAFLRVQFFGLYSFQCTVHISAH